MGTAFVVLVLVLLALLLAGWGQTARGNLVEHQRRAINKTFMTRAVHSENPSLAFDPASAVLIHEKEEIRGETPTVQSTRLYRNPAGEYFFFMCAAGGPGFIKHLSHSEAKRMLKPYGAVFEQEFGGARRAAQDEA